MLSSSTSRLKTTVSVVDEPKLTIEIMFEGKPFAWADIKRKYLRNPAKYEYAIKQANWVRLGLVNALLKEVVTNADPNKTTFFRADGSTDLTSDYDVSLSGAKKEDAAIMFNNMFEEMFGRTSAEVLDSNSYASGPIEDAPDAQSAECKGHFSCSSACVKKSDKCMLIAQLRFRNSAAVVSNQHIWALATILRNISEKEREWLTTEIMTVNNRPRALRRLFKKALQIFEDNPMINDIRQANKKYGEALQEIYQLRLAGEKGAGTKDFAVAYANAESKGGWYAQEAYVTMGPFLHVVGNDQRQLDLALSQDEYKDSFIENVSYILHALDPSASCSQSFVVAAKYIARASFAASQVFETTEDEIVAELSSLMQESVKVRAQRESMLARAAANENVEQAMIKHMRGVSCTAGENTNKSRKEVLQWILSYLILMF